MISKTQQKILLFCYKHQEDYVSPSSNVSIDALSALVEKDYLESFPEMSVDFKPESRTFSICTPDKFKITDSGIEMAERIKESRRNIVSFWNAMIGGIIGTVGGILGIISFFVP